MTVSDQRFAVVLLFSLMMKTAYTESQHTATDGYDLVTS